MKFSFATFQEIYNELSRSYMLHVCFLGNAIIFFLLLFNNTLKHQKNVRLQLLRDLCFCNCCYYYFFINVETCNFYDYYGLSRIVNIFSWNVLSFLITPSFVAKVVYYINGLFVPLTLILEIFYSWEAFQTFKNPISRFSIRKKIYGVITLVIIGICLILNGVFIHTEKELLIFYIQNMVYVLIIYSPISVYSIFIILKNTYIKDRQTLFFAIRYILYVIIVNVLMVGGAIFEDQEKYSLNFLSLFDTALCVIRLLECPFKTTTEEDLQKETDQRFDDARITTRETTSDSIRFSESKRLPLIPQTDKTQFNGLSSESEYEEKTTLPLMSSSIDITCISPSRSEKKLLLILKHKFLSKCIYYAIEGIVSIAKNNLEKKEIPQITEIQLKEERKLYYVLSHESRVTDIVSSLGKVKGGCAKKWCPSLFLPNEVELIEYAPKAFRRLGSAFQLNLEELINSFKINDNLENISKLSGSEGKSGSLFFITKDYKFIIKTIHQKEKDFLVNKFLPQYVTYVAENNSSHLSEIYGLYTLNVGSSQLHLILMENIAPFSNDIIEIKFDLKGSMVGRETKNLMGNKKKTLKDNDYLRLKNSKINIQLEKDQKARFKEMLKSDLSFLQRCNSMDYSLFIAAIENKDDNYERFGGGKRCFLNSDRKYFFYIGIIDYLTEYGRMKNLEHFILNIFYKKNMASAVAPKMYSHRMYYFLTTKVIES